VAHDELEAMPPMLAGDPIGHLSGALDQAGVVIARVRPEQATLPTPCAGWDVRALVNHVVYDVDHFTALTEGAPWEASDSDRIGADWPAAYRAAASSLLAAWRRPGVLERPVRLPFGEFPGAWRVGQQLTDLVVHAWDVAKATGQPTDLDPGLGQLALEWARRNLKPEFRGQAFGAEVRVRDDAPLYDRLAGFFGRDPSWPAVKTQPPLEP
jgi:uncharacterized protein (TIGR03086 family)